MDKNLARYMTFGKEVKSSSTQETYKLVESMSAEKATVRCVSMQDLNRYSTLTEWVRNWEQNSMGFRERFKGNIDDCKTELATYESEQSIADIMPNNEIRFITPTYQTKFKVTDLETVLLNGDECKVSYIDEHHFSFVGHGECFHICQFAELCEQGSCNVTPIEQATESLDNNEEYEME